VRRVRIHGHPSGEPRLLGLYALQHRDRSPPASSPRTHARIPLVGMGQVADVFPRHPEDAQGQAAAGHVRYSTAGSSHLVNAQPIHISYHSGRSRSPTTEPRQRGAPALRARGRGLDLPVHSDTEVILHLIARSSYRELDDALTDALRRVDGAYSLVFLTLTGSWPSAIRAASGRSRSGSSTRVVRGLGELRVRPDRGHIRPGRRAGRDGDPGRERDAVAEAVRPAPSSKCIFEYVYFARPTRTLRAGRERGAQADGGLPGRGASRRRRHRGAGPRLRLYAGLGYAERSGIPFELGLVATTTWAAPSSSQAVDPPFRRQDQAEPRPGLLAGKRVVLVDDSIVRGTTSRKIVTMIKEAAPGRSTSGSPAPHGRPVLLRRGHAQPRELIAATHAIEEIRRYIRATSLGYLSSMDEGAVAPAMRTTASARPATRSSTGPAHRRGPRPAHRSTSRAADPEAVSPRHGRRPAPDPCPGRRGESHFPPERGRRPRGPSRARKSVKSVRRPSP